MDACERLDGPEVLGESGAPELAIDASHPESQSCLIAADMSSSGMERIRCLSDAEGHGFGAGA
jgi:hypothetical protein